ncbi:ABC-transporter-regulating transcription factor [Psilocybe cubensis]|uniref:ABC-transporter-regulating transcription factor n=1 Tax=Psilocybe cubensis TaxID=181762 RepID=A0ACB8GM60_PSICU|nr:ABC-transporter-regulating transcription factor [Psilocybe cubensis]KAH9476291.1 ABC-transporter-regulating transcription factor [Psilocybe cubensis]
MPPVTTADTQEQQAASSSSTSILKERRFKLSRACDRCRRRRIKCDEGHPCQACLTANSSCTFEEPGKRTHPHKSKRTATLEDRMHHLETLIQAIPPAVFAAGGAPSIPSSSDVASSPVVPFMYPDGMPSGVPPPSLHVFPLMNPSNHFTREHKVDERHHSPHHSFSSLLSGGAFNLPQEEPSRLSLTASYLYFDDEGYTRWQGETSGLPVLDLLVERHSAPPARDISGRSVADSNAAKMASANAEWFPDRQPRRTDDYGNPQKWGEPGFASFIVAVCCLASRHMDDPRVRADPNDGISAGTQWFELFGRLRTLPISDRPTLYNIQANLIAAVYAVGLGKLSKAAALLAEAVTMSIDAGLHRSADSYDLFDAIEDEVRKRTFWCVYIWDKQLGAHFGRPSMLRLRDCDVSEPSPVDDEFITRDAINTPPPGTESRMSAFIVSLRIMVVLEAVLDVPPARQSEDPTSFLLNATKVLSGTKRFKEMREEEALLDDIHRKIPAYWSHSPETLNSDDTIRLTQAERLHCAEQFVRLLIYRHRFSELVAERTSGPIAEEQSEAEQGALIAAHNSALQIVSAHVHIAKKGLMTYYGVHVIHQLTQAGRTLVAVLLCCKTDALQHLIPPGLDALRSCIGLLRRFSGRYVCGLRSGDLMEEFCRLTNIPLETARQDGSASATRPPWIRPVRKKAPSVARSNQSGDSPSHHSSPEAFSPSDFFAEPLKTASAFPSGPPLPGPGPASSSSVASPPQYAAQPVQTNGNNNSSFMDTSGMEMMRDDSHMYMSQEMMALFNDGGVDVQHLFSSDFMQPISPQQAQQQQQQQQQQHHIGNGNDSSTPSAGFAGPNFLKMNGLATSP